MDFKQIIKIIYQKKWLVFWITVLGTVLAFDLAVIQIPQYKASSKMLVVQKQVAGQDIYTISKSAQYLCRVLKKSIYSDNFFEKAFLHGLEDIDFSVESKQRRKQWEKAVKVNIVRDLGIIEINVFYPEKEKAEQINLAIANVLEKNHQFYHGSDQNVELKILNKPLVSQKPITINLWLWTILGALIGLCAGAGLAIKRTLKSIKLPYNPKNDQGLLLADKASYLDRNDFSI